MNFIPYSGSEGLPFPLYLPFEAKLLITAFKLLTLFYGFKFKVIILRFMKSPESTGPINALIWFDQLNRLFLGIAIVLKLIAINYPLPMSQIGGIKFCEWASIPGY